ncbi:MAG: Gfo/Idh/MocA family oxidoreductase [Candidatus Daviesbacteria bacterium]|nr:Gfo/Idh/MocA family oxidoreductase [Candidatus Daviesbacteria bacterium]
MKIIFFGLGSIGQRHAKILLENYTHDLYAFRSGENNDVNKLGIKEIYTFDEVKNLQPDIAFITNPTAMHIETALKCAELGCKLFIEKPVGKDTDGLEKLINIVKKKKLVTYIAYNLRFHPVIKKIKEYLKRKKPVYARVVCTSFLPAWRPNTDHLKGYSANTAMGGGVILDLSHEMDYVGYLLGGIKKISGNFAKVSNVTVDAEDYADMTVISGGVPVNIHLDFLSQIRQRYIQIDFEKLTVVADLIDAEIKEHEGGIVKNSIELDYNRGQEYEEQLKYFFDNIDNPRMMNNLIEAGDLFKKIVTFKNG